MKQFRNVFKFEFYTYMKNKAYLTTTIILLLLVLIVGNLPNIVGAMNSLTQKEDVTDSADEKTIKKGLLYDRTNNFTDEILSEYYPNYEWERLEFDTDTAYSDVEAGKYDVALEIDGLNYTVIQKNDSLFSIYANDIDSMVQKTYQNNELKKQGLSQDVVDQIMNAKSVANYISVGKDISQSYWVGYVLLMLLYLSIQMYSQFVMTSVVTEKSTKTMEILITSVKPFYLMFGKVIGVGLAGITQLATVLLTGFAMIALNKSAWETFSPTVAAVMSMSANLGTFIYAVIFFILGFFSFAFLYAAFASTVSRMEEANSVMLMPMMIFMASFFVAMFGGMMNPENIISKVCAFVPLMSPLVMFARICVTDVPLVQVVISILINIISVFGIGVFSARLYRAGVMMYGKTPSLIQTFKYVFKG